MAVPANGSILRGFAFSLDHSPKPASSYPFSSRRQAAWCSCTDFSERSLSNFQCLLTDEKKLRRSADRLWPLKARTALLSVPVILLVLPGIVAVLRGTLGWPSNESEGVVLLGIIVLSLLPILLALIDLAIVGSLIEEHEDGQNY